MKAAIKNFRLQKGLTQADLAHAVGISLMALKRYEYGERLPNVQTAMRISKILNVPIDKLWGTAESEVKNGKSSKN